jgi:hypothetical protein
VIPLSGSVSGFDRFLTGSNLHKLVISKHFRRDHRHIFDRSPIYMDQMHESPFSLACRVDLSRHSPTTAEAPSEDGWPPVKSGAPLPISFSFILASLRLCVTESAVPAEQCLQVFHCRPVKIPRFSNDFKDFQSKN